MSEIILPGQIPGGTDNETSEPQLKRRKADLPVFTLKKKESFYIKREDLGKLNDAYFKLFDDIKAGRNYVPAEMRSYMESVMFNSYCAEIEKLQLNGKLSGEIERLEAEKLTELLTPCRWRWFFRRRCNQAAVLFDEKISRLAHNYYFKKQSELPEIQSETFGEVFTEFKEQAMRSVIKELRYEMRETLGFVWQAYSNRDRENIEKLFKILETIISEGIRKKKRCLAVFSLLDKLIECYTLEEQARTSDIMVLKLIAEILKGRTRYLSLCAPPTGVEEPAEEESKQEDTEQQDEPQTEDVQNDGQSLESDGYDEVRNYDWTRDEIYHKDSDEQDEGNPDAGDEPKQE